MLVSRVIGDKVLEITKFQMMIDILKRLEVCGEGLDFN